VSLVAVVGDATKTTALALAASWPVDDRVVIVEADPSGGSLAAWLDVPVEPSLSSVVTRTPEGRWSIADSLTRTTPSGLRIVPAPVLAAEARHAVGASGDLMRTMASLDDVVVVADAGRSIAGDRSPALDRADSVVVVHRQARESARAAAVRLERLVESVEVLDGIRSGPLVVAVLGRVPFDVAEISGFVRRSVCAAVVVELPVDPLAAAVLAGHAGVSERRLRRQPLMRAASSLASELAIGLPTGRHRRDLDVLT
jgi:MinD-like ATPase involved in chromosome partitioning or flagellar assembly